jgi:hypothetical protein
MQESEARLMEVREHRASPLRENVGSQRLPKSHGASVHEAHNNFIHGFVSLTFQHYQKRGNPTSFLHNNLLFTKTPIFFNLWEPIINKQCHVSKY